MDKVNDILGNSSNKNYATKYNNSNNWRDEQAKERTEAYTTIEKMSIAVKTSGNKFKEYLDIQTRFNKHSIGNCFLILARQPNATQFKDKKSWEELGISLIVNPKSFSILEPNKSKKNGKIYYNPKKVYDISQTKAEKPKKVEYDMKELLTAFIHNCFAEIKVVDSLQDETMATKYNKEDNVLYICRGMEKEVLFQSLSQDLANIEMRKEKESDYKAFKSYCISYMLCQKYGIDVSNYDFNSLPEEIRGCRNGKEIRKKLDNIRVDFETINTRIAEHFENCNREKKKREKVQER